MKKTLLSLVAGFLLISGAQANACPRSQERLICPGDKVVDNNGNVGVASGINPFQNQVSIDFGDSYDTIKNIKYTALGLGCLEGYCVGDFAVDNNGNRGRIDAVNPYNRTVALNYGGRYDEIKNIKSVALGIGCMMGYCVGDRVIDNNGNRGIIEAINSYTGQAAISYGGPYDTIKNIQYLASSKFCATYGDQERSVKVFPILIESKYISLDFKFSLTRPIQ